MQLNDYQERAAATVIYPKDKAFFYLRPGLLIEVLELEEAFRSVSDPVYLLNEMGDIAWFVANSFNELNLQLADYRQWAKQTNGLESVAAGIEVLKYHARKSGDLHVKAIRDRQSETLEELLFHLSTIFHTLDLMTPLLDTNLAAILQMNANDLVKCRRCNFFTLGRKSLHRHFRRGQVIGKHT